MIDRAVLFVSAQRALLFGVSKAARYISIEERDGGLQMRVYLDIEPDPDECDIYYAASGEITGDFVELDEARSTVELIADARPYEELDHLEHLVFARAD